MCYSGILQDYSGVLPFSSGSCCGGRGPGGCCWMTGGEYNIDSDQDKAGSKVLRFIDLSGVCSRKIQGRLCLVQLFLLAGRPVPVGTALRVGTRDRCPVRDLAMIRPVHDQGGVPLYGRCGLLCPLVAGTTRGYTRYPQNPNPPLHQSRPLHQNLAHLGEGNLGGLRRRRAQCSSQPSRCTSYESATHKACENEPREGTQNVPSSSTTQLRLRRMSLQTVVRCVRTYKSLVVAFGGPRKRDHLTFAGSCFTPSHTTLRPQVSWP